MRLAASGSPDNPEHRQFFRNDPHLVSLYWEGMSWDGVQELIDGAKSGDQQAWCALHDMVRPYMLEILRRDKGPDLPEVSVSDLTQQAWQRVMSGIAGFHGGPDELQTAAMFRAWLRQILKHTHLNQRRLGKTQRRKAPTRLLSLDVAVSDGSSEDRPGCEPISKELTPSTNAVWDERKTRIKRAIDRLDDPVERELLRLRFFEGLPFDKVAAQLGMSSYDVRVRLQETLDRLKLELEGLI
jgi:RNA polymerase sigma factor (sigma-70 family)